MQWSVTAVIDR